MIVLFLLAQDVAERTKEFREHISKVRGLEFRRDVPVAVYGRDELRAFVLTEFERQFPKAKAEKVQKAYAHFGLTPESLNLHDALIVLFTESVAGFYHPPSRGIRLIRPEESVLPSEGQDFAVDLLDVTLVHELVHAAQDQNFDFRTLPIEEEADDDLVAAMKALIEGDAFAVGWNHVYRATFDRVIRLISDRYKTGRLAGKAGELPEFLRMTAVFPEGYGSDFVLAGRRSAKGDWKSLSRLFEDPPGSTEQILHPEKYFDRRDSPVVVTLPDLGDAWRPMSTNVHGEFTIRIMVGERAAAGWDGDRYRLIEHNGILSSVWYSRWDSELDAREFFDAYGARIRLRGPGLNEVRSTRSRQHWSDGSRHVLLERRGDSVLAIDGEAGLVDFADRIWNGVRVEERTKVERFTVGRWECAAHPNVRREVNSCCPECGERLVPQK